MVPRFSRLKVKEKHNTNKVVALKYDSSKDAAPKVTAKGKGVIAEKIIEIAKENSIPIKDDPELVDILSMLDLDEEIPSSVYHVVAEILAFVYSLKNKWREKG